MSYDEEEEKFDDDFGIGDDELDIPEGIMADDYDLEDENPDRDG